MNRVIIINLNGIAYQLEESGYDALRTYLDNAAQRLEGNPDKNEIMADIEQAIADKFRAVLGANKNVVMTREVENALGEMGPVQDGNSTESSSSSGNPNSKPGSANSATSSGQGPGEGEKNSGTAKKLYTIPEGAMFFGVCNGLAAYFGIDVTIVRVLFVILSWFWGAGILLYVVLGLMVPTATTSAEKAEAFGGAATAQEFIRRAKEGYYEGMKSFHDKNARREWKRKFKRDMHGWSRNFQSEMQRWQQNWSNRWPHPPHPGAGPAFAAPFFFVINFALLLVAVFAVYSLVKTGVVFGFSLPAGMPLWVGVVILFVIWRCVTWPLKAMRWHAYNGYPHNAGPCGGFSDGIASIAIAVLVFWLADHYIPQFHEALKQLPPLLHQAVDSIQSWLDKR